jgi:putative sigma-54 modulation protein
MRIELKGRNARVHDGLREQVEKRCRTIDRQVSELAILEIEISEERNPAIPDSQIAEATLYLKGTTLRARDASSDMAHSINLVCEELTRQVKRHREKQRKRRDREAPVSAELPGDFSPAT